MSRLVQKVELKSRPGLAIYVGTLSAIEAIGFHERLKSLEKTEDILSEQVATLVCNMDGTRRYADANAALELMRELMPGQIRKVVEAGVKFNDLSDELIEEELKN